MGKTPGGDYVSKLQNLKTLTVAFSGDEGLHGGRRLGAVVWIEGEKETERDYHY